MSVKIILGDCIEEMRKMPAGSVHCCVTSPPYYGLRDYGVVGQIGLERTPNEFISKMVSVFEEVRRVLRKDGTCWVNMGDSYAGTGDREPNIRDDGSLSYRAGGKGMKPRGFKNKDLMGMPWRLAFALQDAGWYLRQDIIWAKPNPMPESVNDRCTKSHEYIFLLSKSARYYYDCEAIKEPVSLSTHARLSQNIQAQIGSARANGGEKTNGNMKAVGRSSWNGSEFHTGKTAAHQLGRAGKNRKLADAGSGTKNNSIFDSSMEIMPEFRNKRSVWTVATQSYKEAHFATYPAALIRPCILAGCPLGGGSARSVWRIRYDWRGSRAGRAQLHPYRTQPRIYSAH